MRGMSTNGCFPIIPRLYLTFNSFVLFVLLCFVLFFILEKRNIMDFFLLNYWQGKSHISTVSSIILDYKFNHDSVELLSGANQIATVTYDELQKRWADLFSQFYTQYETPVEVITFPEVIRFNEVQVWEKAMSILKKWCEQTSKKYGLIIRNYDLKGHLNFSKINIDVNDESNEKLLLFNPTQRVLLTIFFNENVELLEQQVFSCIDEVNLLSLLLREELIYSDVMVAGLVVYSGENNHDKCLHCKNFIVSFDIFNSVHHFNSFWDDYTDQEIQKYVPNDKEDIDSRKVFKAVASKVIGFLAHFQFKMFDNAILPYPKKRPEEKIFQTELLLNRYQMEIVYSNKNHIFLTGSYGTGKTIVIYKKIELLQKHLKDNESIYYVNFEEKSHLDSNLLTKMKLDEKVKVIKGGFDLSYIIKNKILPNEYGTGKIHLMVDEYDTQSLSKKEAAELTYIFKKKNIFKNSTIFIAAQPIEISRTVLKLSKIMSKGKHMVHDLKKIMYSYNLDYVMRTTVEIHTLARITEDYLDGKSNHYTLLNPKNDTSVQKKLQTPYLNKRNSKYHGQKRIDHDLLYKLADTSSNKNDKSMWRVITRYCYNVDSSIGHNIHGRLPKLFKISKSADHLEQLALIALFLSSIVEINTKHIAIVHFESQAPIWLTYLLQLTNFNRLKITFDATEFINLDKTQDKQKGELVLVADYRCVKGLEFSNVLLLINENEYYLKHFIPEAMTRCMSNLSILIVPRNKKIFQSETVSALVDKWEEVNNMSNKNPILEIVELKFCSNPICRIKMNNFCEFGGNKYVHKFTKFFKDLYQEIQLRVASNLESDNDEEKEEAKIL